MKETRLPFLLLSLKSLLPAHSKSVSINYFTSKLWEWSDSLVSLTSWKRSLPPKNSQMMVNSMCLTSSYPTKSLWAWTWIKWKRNKKRNRSFGAWLSIEWIHYQQMNSQRSVYNHTRSDKLSLWKDTIPIHRSRGFGFKIPLYLQPLVASFNAILSPERSALLATLAPSVLRANLLFRESLPPD